MADKRAYFKLDVGYLTNPKVAAASLESQGAVILHIGCIAYAAQHLTDGLVPIALVRRLTGTCADDATVLYKHGLLHEAGDGIALVHDFLEHQRSSSEVKGAADKARAAADARWSDHTDASRNASSNAPSMPDALHVASDAPMPREIGEIGERDIPTGASQAQARFDEFWDLYPKKKDKGKALKAWTRAVKVTDPDTILRAVRRYAADPDVTKEKYRYAKYPATWLNAQAWEDEPATVTHLPTKRRTPEQILDGWMYQ